MLLLLCWIVLRCKLTFLFLGGGGGGGVAVCLDCLLTLVDVYRNPSERPTADVLLSQHPFCELDPNYSFLDTDLYSKIRGGNR